MAWLVVMCVVMCLAALAGCGDEGGTTTTSTLKATAWRAASYSDVKDGGSLTLAIDSLPANFNTLQIDDGLASTYQIEAPLTAGNQGNGTRVNAEGVASADPTYITSAKIVSTDPQVAEIRLNPKGAWSDGTPITWRDFRSFWQSMNGHDPRYQAFSTDGFEDITAVTRGSDDYTYRVTFARPKVDWIDYVYPQLPSVVTATPAAFNTGFASRPFPSNGPFMVASVDRTAGVVIEKRNPHWWGRTPRLDTVVFRVVDQAEQAQAFTNGELDAVDTSSSRDLLDAAQRRSGSSVQRSAGVSWTQLTLNGTSGPLKNVHVRRAVAHAIDRTKMAKVLSAGMGTAPQTVGSVIYVPGQAGYLDTASKLMAYSPARARSELVAAGYRHTSGVWKKDGTTLTLSITVPSDTTTAAQRAAVIAGYLRRIGIVVKVVTVQGSKFFKEYIDQRKFELATFIWSAVPFPISSTQPMFTPADSAVNYSGITDPALEGLWARADTQLDRSKRVAIAHQIDDVVLRLVPIVPISVSPNVWVVRHDLANFGATQFQTADWTSVGYVK